MDCWYNIGVNWIILTDVSNFVWTVYKGRREYETYSCFSPYDPLIHERVLESGVFMFIFDEW